MVQLKSLFSSKKFRSIFGFFIGGCVGLFVLFLIFGISFLIHYHGRIYPGIMIGPVSVGGLTETEAVSRITASVSAYQQRWPVVFQYNNQQLSVPLANTSIVYLIDSSVRSAMTVGRNRSLASISSLAQSLTSTVHIPLQSVVEDEWLTMASASIAAQVDSPSIPPKLEVKNGVASVVEGTTGTELNQEKWRQRIQQSLTQLTMPDGVLEMETIDPTITPEQAKTTVDRANALLKTELALALNSDELVNKTWKLSGTELVQFLQFDGGYNQQKLTEYVTGVATAVNREPKDAKFQFDESTGKVKEFVAPEKGIVVDVTQTVALLQTSLSKLSQGETVEPVQLVVKEQNPSVTLAEVNRLGLKDRLGVGTSTYKGSIPGRVHNVELAATRLNGTLVKPGETFSFNTAVGEVSAATGYQQAYIIQDGKTQLGDGGGLCQDSTTMFRAALDAGLPIVSRRGHAYRVGYYEQDSKPGFDATVFSPSTDLTFTNDTPAYLLIQTAYDSPARKLTYVIYGTSDGRKSTIKDYAMWDVTPPPPDVYQDDPTLPVGTTKQVDWKAVGSKTKFTYIVERQGQTIFEKTFVTNYRPWASIYLRGTKQ